MLGRSTSGPVRLSVEGNIAAGVCFRSIPRHILELRASRPTCARLWVCTGKSTLLRLLAEELDFVAVPEPLNKWQRISTQNSSRECVVVLFGFLSGNVALAGTDDDDDSDSEATLHRSASQESGSNLLQMFYDDPTRCAVCSLRDRADCHECLNCPCVCRC